VSEWANPATIVTMLASVGALLGATASFLNTRANKRKIDATTKNIEVEAQQKVVDGALQVAEAYETAIQRETTRFRNQIAQLEAEVDGLRRVLAEERKASQETIAELRGQVAQQGAEIIRLSHRRRATG